MRHTLEPEDEFDLSLNHLLSILLVGLNQTRRERKQGNTRSQNVRRP
jgi:hypothetical protein